MMHGTYNVKLKYIAYIFSLSCHSKRYVKCNILNGNIFTTVAWKKPRKWWIPGKQIIRCRCECNRHFCVNVHQVIQWWSRFSGWVYACVYECIYITCLHAYMLPYFKVSRRKRLATAHKATDITKRDMKSFQTHLIPAVNSSLLMESVSAPTAEKDWRLP